MHYLYVLLKNENNRGKGKKLFQNGKSMIYRIVYDKIKIKINIGLCWDFYKIKINNSLRFCLQKIFERYTGNIGIKIFYWFWNDKKWKIKYPSINLILRVDNRHAEHAIWLPLDEHGAVFGVDFFLVLIEWQ